MVDGGAKNGACINHQVGHTGLDARCRGFIAAFEEKGLPAQVLGVKGEDAAQTQTTISDFYTANPDVNAFMTLGPAGSDHSTLSWKAPVWDQVTWIMAHLISAPQTSKRSRMGRRCL
jgi:hypothetical protein